VTAYRVIAPYVTLKVRNDQGQVVLREFYVNAPVPAAADPENVDRLLRKGMLAALDAPAEPVVERAADPAEVSTRPAQAAAKADWVTFAAAQRPDGQSEQDARAEAEAMSKADLIATVARRVASGWLKSVTGLSDFAAPVDDQLFAWGLELAAIAFRNPDGASSESIDDHTVQWDRARRRDILAAATAAYSSGAQPQFSFPDPDWHWTVVPVVPLTA
jgi:hypothetical protein